jgi:hypothetical protein
LRELAEMLLLYTVFMENTAAKNRSEIGNMLFSWLRREPLRQFPGSLFREAAKFRIAAPAIERD